MSNSFQKYAKKVVIFLLAGAMTIKGMAQPVSASTNYGIEKTIDKMGALNTNSDFEKYLAEQFSKNTIHLEGDADKYIDSITINGHNVSIKLKSGNIYSKEFDNVNLKDMTLGSLYLLNISDGRYIREEDRFYNIRNVTVEDEFKAHNNCVDPKNVNLSGCKRIWLNDWHLSTKAKSSWINIFNQQGNTTDLILTNTTFGYGFEEPIMLAFNGMNLQNIVITGFNPEVVDIFISDPLNLKTAVFGDDTSIEDLNNLRNADDLEYFNTGIYCTNEMYQTMSFDTFLEEMKGYKGPHYNCINDPICLKNKKLSSIDLSAFIHCNVEDIQSVLETNPIKSLSNDRLSPYFGENFSEFLKEREISYLEDENKLSDAFWENIRSIKIDKNISEFDKVKSVIIEYVKANKSTLYDFTEEDCFNIIILLKRIGIDAYCIDAFSHSYPNYKFNMAVSLDSGYAYLDTSQIVLDLGAIINTPHYLDKYLNETTKNFGEVINTYWENLVEDALAKSNFLVYDFKKNNNVLNIPGTLIPSRDKERIMEQLGYSGHTSDATSKTSDKHKNILERNMSNAQKFREMQQLIANKQGIKSSPPEKAYYKSSNRHRGRDC